MIYTFPSGGLPNELAAISDNDTTLHLRNYIGNFILDNNVCSVYINRLASVSHDNSSAEIQYWTRFLIDKYAKLNPFDKDATQLKDNILGTSSPYIRDLTKCTPPQDVQNWLTDQFWRMEPQQARSRLMQLFKTYSYAPSVISRLIYSDLQLDIPAGIEWSNHVKLPPSLRPIMQMMLAEASHLQNLDAEAIALIQSSPDLHDNEYWHNASAEIHVRNGDIKQAIRLYAKSLHLDPNQAPVQDRMDELINPFAPDQSTLATRTIICLYSWNKCGLLENTLRSLAASEIGPATIFLLLNGCTDKSLDMAENINRELFQGRINIITLPVNIGAPAARNWLLAIPEVKAAEYVAFLDDDVDIPAHWLYSLLTVLRDNPEAGVAGAKVVNPGSPRRLQYLYRNISVAMDGMIRLSLDTPDRNFDTGIYNYVRETDNVMGCCHVFTRKALDAVPFFDIRFSPSQMDDIAHDLELRLQGLKIIYCGLVSCCHHQMSGVGRSTAADIARRGNVIGNDAKFYFKFQPYLDKLSKLNNLKS